MGQRRQLDGVQLELERLDLRAGRYFFLLDLRDDDAGYASLSLRNFMHPREVWTEEEATAFHGNIGHRVQLESSGSASTAGQVRIMGHSVNKNLVLTRSMILGEERFSIHRMVDIPLLAYVRLL